MREFLRKTLVTILIWEARLVVRKYRPHIVAITGSVGKTSTKDAVYSVLAQEYHVRKSEKSFNSDIGLPLTILGCPNAWDNPLKWLQNIIDGLLLILFRANYPRWLVLEVGADKPGDISSFAKWLPVDIVVITRLPEMPVHVEFFDSPQAVVEEKASLIEALKQDGTLVLYGDDERTRALSARTQGKTIHVLTFGTKQGADVRATHFALAYGEGVHKWPTGVQAHLDIAGNSAPIHMRGVLGTPALFSVLAAAAVGSALGKNVREIVDALETYEPPHGRLHMLPGIKDTLIIDDTYNSSPAAVVAALDTLALINAKGRKIAVLGDMLELGRYSVEEHRKIGAHVAKTADALVTVGFRARGMAEGALDAGMSDVVIVQYEDAYKAGNELAGAIGPGDCVLVKGSQSMRMERVVEMLMQEPERARELLVRQDMDWKKR